MDIHVVCLMAGHAAADDGWPAFAFGLWAA